jgi:PAS domain-containing protein
MSLACERIMGIFGTPLLWVGRKEPDGAVKLFTVGSKAEDYTSGIVLRWNGTAEETGLTGTAIRTGKLQLMDVEDPRLRPWREQLVRHSITTGASFPLKVEGVVLGALTVYAADKDFWSKRTIVHLTNFAEHIALAMQVITTRQRLKLLTAGLESAANAIVITSRRGGIQWVNPAFLALNGVL